MTLHAKSNPHIVKFVMRTKEHYEWVNLIIHCAVYTLSPRAVLQLQPISSNQLKFSTPFLLHNISHVVGTGSRIGHIYEG